MNIQSTDVEAGSISTADTRGRENAGGNAAQALPQPPSATPTNFPHIHTARHNAALQQPDELARLALSEITVEESHEAEESRRHTSPNRQSIQPP